jgi:hypothetical protein
MVAKMCSPYEECSSVFVRLNLGAESTEKWDATNAVRKTGLQIERQSMQRS